VPNCFPEVIERRFRHWVENGVSGVSVRVDRWCSHENRFASVLHSAQEANLWTLARLATGRVAGAREAVVEWARETFGPVAAADMADALSSTGRVMAEALCVGREPFGITRMSIPAIQTMRGRRGRHLPLAEMEDVSSLPVARAYADDEDRLLMSPFHRHMSVFRWDASFREAYGRIRRGDPEVIAQKEKGCAEATALADGALAALERARPSLPPDGGESEYRFYRFGLEESRLHLAAMCEMELAWLKCERTLYSTDPAERGRLLPEIRSHLARLGELYRRHAGEEETVTRGGEERTLRRFVYMDVPGFIEEFRRFWGLDSEG
jgi:hypothetical protein